MSQHHKLFTDSTFEITNGTVGCDEAGRGCLAGRVYAAAVILPPDLHHPGIRDSKTIPESEREVLRHWIETNALHWAVAWCEPEEIDAMNILRASITAMHRALDQIKIIPERILVDGNKFIPYNDVLHHCIIKGDSKYACIAAASILAKTHRDAHMREIHHMNPQYGWNQNKGYPTIQHRRAIMRCGSTIFHRKTFSVQPVPELP